MVKKLLASVSPLPCRRTPLLHAPQNESLIRRNTEPWVGGEVAFRARELRSVRGRFVSSGTEVFLRRLDWTRWRAGISQCLTVGRSSRMTIKPRQHGCGDTECEVTRRYMKSERRSKVSKMAVLVLRLGRLRGDLRLELLHREQVVPLSLFEVELGRSLSERMVRVSLLPIG